MVGLPYRMRIAQQADEAFCEVLVPCHGPKRAAVSMNYDRLALNHTFEHLPAALAAMHTYRNAALAVGMARAYNGHREAMFPVLLHKKLLACYLVAGILPIRICEGRALCDHMLTGRLVIC